ncbi:MAG: helix-turn-helix domain-containing protein [Myxococcota bacterium]
MFDTRKALQDMAIQIRACRSEDGLTLQQLAEQSGVAASTIHKVEAQQMVPTVSVFLKIAKGLGRRPDQLIRDRSLNPDSLPEPSEGELETASPSTFRTLTKSPETAVWRIQLAAQQILPALELAQGQRALFLVERGRISLQSGERRVHVAAGNCIEFEGGTIQSPSAQLEAANLTLIVTPPGSLASRLGAPTGSNSEWETRTQSAPSTPIAGTV